MNFSAHDHQVCLRPADWSIDLRNLPRQIPAPGHLSALELAFVRELQIAFPDRLTQLRIHQLMDIETHGFPGIGSHVENSCVHPDRILRTYFNAVTAINADSQIDIETHRVLFNIRVRMLTRHNRDALGRANCFAEHAPHATRSVIFTAGPPVTPAKTPHERTKPFRKLIRHNRRKVPESAERMTRMAK